MYCFAAPWGTAELILSSLNCGAQRHFKGASYSSQFPRSFYFLPDKNTIWALEVDWFKVVLIFFSLTLTKLALVFFLWGRKTLLSEHLAIHHTGWQILLSICYFMNCFFSSIAELVSFSVKHSRILLVSLHQHLTRALISACWDTMSKIYEVTIHTSMHHALRTAHLHQHSFFAIYLQDTKFVRAHWDFNDPAWINYGQPVHDHLGLI